MPLEAANCNLEVVEGHCDDQSPDREGRNDARTRAASEMSRSSTVTPAAALNAWMTGRSEYVARAGASSVWV